MKSFYIIQFKRRICEITGPSISLCQYSEFKFCTPIDVQFENVDRE